MNILFIVLFIILILIVIALVINLSIEVIINPFKLSIKLFNIEIYKKKNQDLYNLMVKNIEEMEEKFPSGVKVTSLTSNGEGISMDIEVSTKEEAAKILQNLATFDAFRSVTTNGITESTDENGKITVTFSVMCTYVNGTADDSIDTETTPEEDVETYMNGDQYIYPDMEGSTESGEADNE